MTKTRNLRCNCRAGNLEIITETGSLKRKIDGREQITEIYQCGTCNLFYKRKKKVWNDYGIIILSRCVPYNTKLTKEEIQLLAKQSKGDIPINIEKKIIKWRK